jgi:hypothetical protein
MVAAPKVLGVLLFEFEERDVYCSPAVLTRENYIVSPLVRVQWSSSPSVGKGENALSDDTVT